MLEKGQVVADFKLKNQDNKLVSLSNFKDNKVLIWFYPKASTPGWTVQGQGLRDEFQAFKDKNIVVIGISADSVKRQKSFCDKQNFPFILLSDESKETIKSFGAWGEKKFMGREYEGIHRYAFLIDKDMTIIKVYTKIKTKSFAKDVLADLK